LILIQVTSDVGESGHFNILVEGIKEIEKSNVEVSTILGIKLISEIDPPYLQSFGSSLWYSDTCPKNDAISFFRKRFCALDLGVELEMAEIRFRLNVHSGKCSRSLVSMASTEKQSKGGQMLYRPPNTRQRGLRAEHPALKRFFNIFWHIMT